MNAGGLDHDVVAGHVAETPDPRLVIRQQADHEGHRGIADDVLVIEHRPASIQHHHDGERRDLVAEERDGLFLAVVGDDEVVLLQIGDEARRLVLHGRVDRDEFGGGAELERVNPGQRQGGDGQRKQAAEIS